MPNFFLEAEFLVRDYNNVLREKQKQLQDFRRFITWKSPGGFIKNKLGAGIGFVRSWIENMFTDEMNWDNYGAVWVIDHIVPFRMFDLFNDADLSICWNYRNLMPLLWNDNLKKQGNVFFAFELLHERKYKDRVYRKLFEIIKPEVEWMVKYIDNYDKK